jgi:probable HAF family extracellular repeat protein
MNRPARLFIALLILMADKVQSAPAATFAPLGFLPGGFYFSSASSVSANGTVVVGASHSSNGGLEAFRWTTGTGMVGIGDLAGGDFLSMATSVSNDGSIVVGSGSAQDSALADGFWWSSQAGIQPLGHFSVPGFNFSYGLGVSFDGLIAVGDSRSTSGNEAFRWTAAEGLHGLGDLPGGAFESYADAISGDGKVIVGESKSAAALEPFRWTAEDGMQGLGFLPGLITESHANSVSYDGSVIVGSDGAGAWRWTKQTGTKSLGVELESNGIYQRPISVSGDGWTVVGSESLGGPRAFLWDPVGGMQNLQLLLQSEYGVILPGWTLTYANGVSFDGSIIVGEGINPAGRPEAWIINLAVPEPPSVVILFTGILMLSRRQHVTGRKLV